MTRSLVLKSRCYALLMSACLAPWAAGANQTPTVSPVSIGSTLPFTTTIQPSVDFPGYTLPTLHSFAKATHAVDGHNQWLLVGGMSNGMHSMGGAGFDPSFHNESIHVIDPVTKQHWSRSLVGSGLTEMEVASLAATNAQSTQIGSRLYIAGGYGRYIEPTFGDLYYTTFDRLSAIDIPGIMNWVKTGAGNASDHIRQISDPVFRVTGGDLHTTANGRSHLVFGQDYPEAYEPRLNGIYTHQVRTFNITDDGTSLGVSDVVLHPAQNDYRRRDLNVVPIMDNVNGQLVEKVQALSGVFTTSFGAWTVPVTIDDQGNATQPNPNDPSTFKQGMNGYRCATIGLYSETRDEMHTLLLGGISYQFYNPVTGQIESDVNLPFTSDATDIMIDADGNMTQHILPGTFPDIIWPVNGEPFLLGAETRFFLADGIDTYANGVIKLDELTGPTVVGYLYGGIAAVQPNGGPTFGSNLLFPVVISPNVPEPTSALLVAGFAFLTGQSRTRRSVAVREDK